MSAEERGKVIKLQKGADLDFAFGILSVIHNCMTAIKEGKMIRREQAVAAAQRKSAVPEAEVETRAKEAKGEEAFEEPEISFQDAFAKLKPIYSNAGKEEQIEKERFDGSSVTVLASTFEQGSPEEKEEWRSKLSGREEEVNYLKAALRYWYSNDWYGSEKRKKPA